MAARPSAFGRRPDPGPPWRVPTPNSATSRPAFRAMSVSGRCDNSVRNSWTTASSQSVPSCRSCASTGNAMSKVIAKLGRVLVGDVVAIRGQPHRLEERSPVGDRRQRPRRAPRRDRLARPTGWPRRHVRAPTVVTGSARSHRHAAGRARDAVTAAARASGASKQHHPEVRVGRRDPPRRPRPREGWCRRVTRVAASRIAGPMADGTAAESPRSACPRRTRPAIRCPAWAPRPPAGTPAARRWRSRRSIGSTGDARSSLGSGALHSGFGRPPGRSCNGREAAPRRADAPRPGDRRPHRRRRCPSRPADPPSRECRSPRARTRDRRHHGSRSTPA